MDGFISSTDVRLVKEAVSQLIIKQSPLTLKCLHESCKSSLKHKTIRQFSSMLKLKGQKLEFTDGSAEYRLVGWHEGTTMIYALDKHIDKENIAAKNALSKLSDALNDDEPIVV